MAPRHLGYEYPETPRQTAHPTTTRCAGFQPSRSARYRATSTIAVAPELRPGVGHAEQLATRALRPTKDHRHAHL